MFNFGPKDHFILFDLSHLIQMSLNEDIMPLNQCLEFYIYKFLALFHPCCKLLLDRQLSEHRLEGALHVDQHLVLLQGLVSDLADKFQIGFKLLFSDRLFDFALSEVLARTFGLCLSLLLLFSQFSNGLLLPHTQLTLLIEHGLKIFRVLRSLSN